ncbi:MAG: thermonuclease family protein [Bacteriovoracaceae bacterium]|nr:thermonuclease family protein [Bacteriovoracaceae bacterium]
MLIFLLTSWLMAQDCPHGSDRFNCVKFIKNYDGDTLTVTIPGIHPFFGTNLKVRVLGIDTPEMKGKTACETQWARVARNLVEAELKHSKRIDLKVDHKHKLDKYGRLLADVLYDGKNLKDVLIKNRLAVEYYGKKKQKIDWCKMKDKI